MRPWLGDGEDAQAAVAPWHGPFEFITGGVAENREAQRCEDGDPPVRRVGLLGQGHGIGFDLAGVQVLNADPGADANNVRRDFRVGHDDGAVELRPQFGEDAVRAGRGTGEGKSQAKLLVIGRAEKDGGSAEHEEGRVERVGRKEIRRPKREGRRGIGQVSEDLSRSGAARADALTRRGGENGGFVACGR